MKKIVKSGKIIIVLISLIFGAVLSGCDQEALFWDIAHEYPPIEPDIGGRTTKIVEVVSESRLYISNNTNHLWYYDTTGADPFWREDTLPGFPVRDLAVANDKLFALDREGNIWKLDVSTWKCIVPNANAEKLFGAGNFLYISVRTGDLNGGEYAYKIAYKILCLNEDGAEQGTAIDNTGLLMGAVAVGPNVYLGTLGGGLYSETAGALTQNMTYGDTIIGLAAYNTEVFILGPSMIYFYNNGDTIPTGYSLSGAVAGWTDEDGDSLLLVGVQHSSGSFGYGYRELQIDANGDPKSGLVVPGAGIDITGKRLSSVKLGSQYVSAIGEHAVNNFYVMPPPPAPAPGFEPPADDGDSNYNAGRRPVIFGATVKDGLWSYRTRNGNAQWNGEDRTGY